MTQPYIMRSHFGHVRLILGGAGNEWVRSKMLKYEGIYLICLAKKVANLGTDRYF